MIRMSKLPWWVQLIDTRQLRPQVRPKRYHRQDIVQFVFYSTTIAEKSWASRSSNSCKILQKNIAVRSFEKKFIHILSSYFIQINTKHFEVGCKIERICANKFTLESAERHPLTCFTSLAVGTSKSARGLTHFIRPVLPAATGAVTSLLNTGMSKAVVFPAPLCAQTNRSRPASTIGIE